MPPLAVPPFSKIILHQYYRNWNRPLKFFFRKIRNNSKTFYLNKNRPTFHRKPLGNVCATRWIQVEAHHKSKKRVLITSPQTEKANSFHLFIETSSHNMDHFAITKIYARYKTHICLKTPFNWYAFLRMYHYQDIKIGNIQNEFSHLKKQLRIDTRYSCPYTPFPSIFYI